MKLDKNNDSKSASKKGRDKIAGGLQEIFEKGTMLDSVIIYSLKIKVIIEQKGTSIRYECL